MLPRFSFTTTVSDANGWKPIGVYLETVPAYEMIDDINELKALSQQQLGIKFSNFSIDRSHSFFKDL